MKILVVGGGGREHALTWALAGNGVDKLICAPGNPGMENLAETFPVGASDVEGLVRLASEQEVDLVVVGPEAPLVEGLADRMREKGIPCFGPGKSGARLESSKWFAKEIMKAAGVPTASGEIFRDMNSALEYMGSRADEYVIKADGLAAGKGVFLPVNRGEAEEVLEKLFSGLLGRSGMSVVVERRLVGREVSILGICSGTRCVLLPPSRDHKRLGEGDTGPNTGGMGAICPPGNLGEDFMVRVKRTIMEPVLEELASRGIEYAGVLYAGLMLTDEGPKVLEFNVRFGDPETQTVLPLVKSDLTNLCMAAATGESLPRDIVVREGAGTCVVMASGGYPFSYRKGYPISGVEDVSDALVFHAGTAVEDGRLVTAGGRVLSVVAVAPTLEESTAKAYRELDKISFENSYHRRDIGG